jgi:crossover junction endonuclease MUS81
MNSSIILEIDYREKAIIKHFEDYKPDIQYKITNLVIGDFLLRDNDNDSIYYIIERKTIMDLAASITDGRFREQKQRLLDSIGVPDKIVYILEGNKNQKKFGSISKSVIESSILNLVFKHKYKVINTSNDITTYEILINLYKKVHMKEFDKLPDTNIKMIKKGDTITNNILLHMLSVIPGVSMNIAKKITTVYTTLPELIKEYEKLKECKEKETLLSNIQINDKRKLGVALSKKIYNSLYLNKESKNNNKNDNQECLLD